MTPTGPSEQPVHVKSNEEEAEDSQNDCDTSIAPVATQTVENPQPNRQPRELIVTAQLNGHDVKMLVDTGAGISVIDERSLQELYANETPVLRKESSVKLQTVSGQALPILGLVKVSLGIARGNYFCAFNVVRDLTYEAVLGRDFLQANGAMIDLKKGTLGLDDSPTDSCHEGACPVQVKTTCVIPPSSETILPASLDADFPPGTVGFLGASPHLRERYQLQGAPL